MRRARARSTSRPLPERLIDLKALRASGARAASFEEARKDVEQAALAVLARRDRELLQELLDLFADEYAAGKERESALDFEDLQLLARDLLAGERARSARPSSCASARSWSTSSRTRTRSSAS